MRVEQEEELAAALAELGVTPAPAALVLVGGADGMTAEEMRRVEPLFAEAVAPAADRVGAVVVDGGTDAGVMRLIGRARTAGRGSFPLVGVIAAELVAAGEAEERAGEAARPEPHHTHFVLVPGSTWGDEGRWLARVASVLAPETSVTLLVNGGDIAWDDAARSIAAGRRVIAVEGSGRTADELAAAVRGVAPDPRSRALAESGLVLTVGSNEPEALAALLDDAFAGS